MNKYIEGLAKYIGEHVVGKLDTIEKQNVKEIIVTRFKVWKNKIRRIRRNNGRLDKI